MIGEDLLTTLEAAMRSGIVQRGALVSVEGFLKEVLRSCEFGKQQLKAGAKDNSEAV